MSRALPLLLGLTLMSSATLSVVQAGETAAVDPTRAALDALNKDWSRRDASGVSAAAITKLEALKAQNPDHYEVQWQLARFYYWVSSEPGGNATTQAAQARKGWDASEAAKKLNPAGVEGYYWAAANIGAYAIASGVVAGVKEGLPDLLEENAKKAVQISAKHDQAGPLRALGRFYYKLPWPLQDLDNARIYLQKAYDASPTNGTNLLFLAELEYADGKPEEGKKLLDALFALDPAKGDGPGTRRSQKEGRAFLAAQ